MSSEKALLAGAEFPPLKKGKPRLYSSVFCPYAQRVRILLAHENIEYETVNIHLRSKPEWFAKDINPLGKVPTFQIDDKIVYDSEICNEYIDEVYPGDESVSLDPYQRAKDRMLLEHFPKASVHFFLVFGAYYQFLRSSEEERAAMDFSTFREGLTIFEKELENRKSPFFGGTNPTNIDFLLWPHIERIEALKEVANGFTINAEEFPLMNRWVKRIADVPAIKGTIIPARIHLERWKSMDAGVYYYDLPE